MRSSARFYTKKFELERILTQEYCNDVIIPKAYATWANDSRSWVLKYENGNEEIANKNNIDTTCIVFAEKETGVEIGEISDDSYGTSHGGAAIDAYAHVAIVAWLRNSKAIQSHVSLHELGHTMGLTDLDDEPVSYNAENSRENNLMHWIGYEMYKLRKRSIKDKYRGGTTLDFQWDCLQKINIYENCATPYLNLETR